MSRAKFAWTVCSMTSAVVPRSSANDLTTSSIKHGMPAAAVSHLAPTGLSISVSIWADGNSGAMALIWSE